MARAACALHAGRHLHHRTTKAGARLWIILKCSESWKIKRRKAQNEQTPNSSLPARTEIINRGITALSERKIDPLHDEIMDFASLFESDLAQSFVDRFEQVQASMYDIW